MEIAIVNPFLFLLFLFDCATAKNQTTALAMVLLRDKHDSSFQIPKWKKIVILSSIHKATCKSVNLYILHNIQI